MTGYRRGDTVLVWFPNSDLQTFKKRPAIVVQADNLDTGLPQMLIAMITSNLSRRGHPSRIFVARDSADGGATGLLMDSVIMTDNLATIRFEAVAQTLGRFAHSTDLDAALKRTLGL